MKNNIFELELTTLYAISQKIGQALDQTLTAILKNSLKESIHGTGNGHLEG